MNPPAKLSVTISVGGRFHAFDLARELELQGELCRLITSYPRFKARQWGIPNDHLDSVPSHEFLNRALSRVDAFRPIRRECQFRLVRRFDRIAAGRIPSETRIFVGWSGMSLSSLRRARTLGAVTVVERGSTHIRFQERILHAEHDRLGLPWEGIHPGFIERELQEYDESDFISVPSRFVRDTFVEAGVDDRKIIVTPYGCDTTVFRPLPKPDKTFRVIHCGALNVRKGVHHLIQAFSELRLPNAELWLIGGVSPEIAGILSKSVGSAVFVKGPFPQHMLPRYYSQGSVFCCASLEEGLAMVIPQAMCCSLPVIATYNSGAAELVRDGSSGFLVRAGDVEALKQRILTLYENPSLRDEMSRNAAMVRESDLSWSRYGAQTIANYREIADGSAKARSGSGRPAPDPQVPGLRQRVS